MKSKTKRYVSEEKISNMFTKANLGAVTKVRSLDAGEFNSAYFVTANGKDYVVKIAPQSKEHILSYEKDLMAREVDFYRLIQAKTDVKTPKVFYYDASKSIIDSVYFIMEKLDSKPLTCCKLDKNEKKTVCLKVGGAVAQLHKIKGTAFGYEQTGLHKSWDLALHAMVTDLIDDCKRFNKSAKYGFTLLNFIEKFREVLKKVEPVYTHFDIWDGNVFCEKRGDEIEIAIIDTERGFWGDGIADFVNIEMLADLNRKICVQAYNKTADNPLLFTDEEKMRYEIMRAYLGLIVYTEKFARYKPLQIKYLVNIVLAKWLLKTAFKRLKKFN